MELHWVFCFNFSLGCLMLCSDVLEEAGRWQVSGSLFRLTGEIPWCGHPSHRCPARFPRTNSPSAPSSGSMLCAQHSERPTGSVT